MHDKTVRIGGASGFWGDSSVGAPQLVRHGDIDYLVFDYLAELTMSVLAAARLRKPELGYATDFVTVTMKSLLRDIVARNIRVVSNAGGINPQGCAQALAAIAAEQGIDVRIAVVEGDDVMPLLPSLRQAGIADLQKGLPLPDQLVSANAYLGALPVRQALDQGAQIVITGRCVDSAVTLGVLMHEFGWQAHDYDRLAQGSLAGHIIECGCQATGGLHTDWEQVPDWPNIGYPVLECRADGSFLVGKPPATGGLVSTATVGEQVLYEIGDPAAYLLPDVTCDFTQVTLRQAGPDLVEVRGARGRAPSHCYKVSATYLDGFRCNAQLTIVGIDAVAKAERTAEAILARTRRLFAENGWGDYTRTRVEVLGAESCFGPHAATRHTREAIMRLAVMHAEKAALELFAREIAAAGTSWAPGTTGSGGGRASPSPSIRQYAFLLDKAALAPTVVMDGVRTAVASPAARMPEEDAVPAAAQAPAASAGPARGDCIEVPLIRLAYGRSGDKGDISNIGLMARRPEYLPVLRAEVTACRVADWLGHLVKGSVARYDLPGLDAMNFVCESALDGGGMASLRNDPLGKGMAQILLTMPVRVPRSLLP
ncbi:acyclic terpene utilization AtuA family protein [Cupriavidus sp. SS-3]|uniref:acyclic terpene utilization AtuA family protein n=1 Tax=Cupriavidus sp. SS-3 TaxID=3109596 RepID=UPI002DB97762|nr:acyclic terpene utilization AtuA family protein [Cupriavidus sp. SS-3]MEC3766115.1 acyclic terpene utilization AtuA family protein [Cupriavidus sp. SS-3]